MRSPLNVVACPPTPTPIPRPHVTNCLPAFPPSPQAAKLAAFLEESRIAAAVEGRAPLAAADLATLQGLASAVTAHAALLSYVGPPLDTWVGGSLPGAWEGSIWGGGAGGGHSANQVLTSAAR